MRIPIVASKISTKVLRNFSSLFPLSSSPSCHCRSYSYSYGVTCSHQPPGFHHYRCVVTPKKHNNILCISSSQIRFRHGNSIEYQRYKPSFIQAEQHLDKTAIVDSNGVFSYSDILCRSQVLSANILGIFKSRNRVVREGDEQSAGQRIALLTDQDVTYVVGQFATWMAGGISVPLCTSHPATEWRYFLEDSECSLLLVGERFANQITPVANELGIAVKVLPRTDESPLDGHHFPSSCMGAGGKEISGIKKETETWFDREDESVWKDKPALIVYTSGTTGRPKGVVLTHGNVCAMVSGMVKSWAWSSQDVILHVLPLHHVHGIINALLTPLTCGATCVMEPKFDAERTWNLLTSSSSSSSTLIPHLDRGINVFMAVPTIYAKMIQHYEDKMMGTNVKGQEERMVGAKATGQGCEAITPADIRDTLAKNIRLMVSGSAALPQPVSDRWLEVTGHRLLERYGMTEIGMALTNPLHGDRVVGAVGNPFPEVRVRIVRENSDALLGLDVLAEGNEHTTTVTQGCENQLGELQVQGPNVFSQYWRKTQATEQAFTHDDWFKTGDTAVFEDGVYRIVGRTSVDIIKSGGYKISALDIERHLLAHPNIADVAVVGLPDPVWGQKVAAVVITKDDNPLELQDLRLWARAVLAPYQIPTVLKCLPSSLPRNAMGKVNKKQLVLQVFPDHVQQ